MIRDARTASRRALPGDGRARKDATNDCNRRVLAAELRAGRTAAVGPFETFGLVVPEPNADRHSPIRAPLSRIRF